MSQFIEWNEHQGNVFDSVNDFEIIDCQKCGFKHTVPIPQPEELDEVYREEYYLERTAPSPGTSEYIDWQQKMSEIHGQAELLIGKQRHGPTGNIRLSFESKFTRFGNYINSEYSQDYD